MSEVQVEEDRHRREEAERRAKRKERKVSKSDSQREKDRKRREHTQRILNEQNKKKKLSSGGKSSSTVGPSESSVFESLFDSRAEGFVINFQFRNAPPRPPVGPCFVGLGLEGALQDWSKYKPNAVESHYTWKLHPDPDLGVPLAPSAMDLEGSYVDPIKPDPATGQKRPRRTLHPDDAALLDWKGYMGDSAAEELKASRDQTRAMQRLIASGQPLPAGFADGKTTTTTTTGPTKKGGLKKKHSRVLNESMQSWMKKTTYLANNITKQVHKFTSLAQTKQKTAEEIEQKLANKQTSAQQIEVTFDYNRRMLEMAANTNNNQGTTTKTAQKHPTKPRLKMETSFPLLPDAELWGHAFTHVVVDQPPKVGANLPQSLLEKDDARILDRAFVAHVDKRVDKARMSCQLLVDRKELSSANDEMTTTETENDDNAGAAAGAAVFDTIQQYDLDVLPLKDEMGPHVHFLWMLGRGDGSDGSSSSHPTIATYVPISSRIQLSTGRPATRSMPPTEISKREESPLEEEERAERMAQVDADIMTKMMENKKKRSADNDDDNDQQQTTRQEDNSMTHKLGNFDEHDDDDDDDDDDE